MPGESTTPPPELFSAYLKLAWARDKFQELVGVHNEWWQSRPYKIHYRARPEDKEADFTITDVEQPPPYMPMLMGDVVHNARAALDHTAFALASYHSPTAPESKRFGVTFPLVSNEQGWTKIQGRTKLLPPDAMERIHELQPFRGKQDAHSGTLIITRQMLGRLNQLDRTDRHRVINLTFQGTGSLPEPNLPAPLVAEPGFVAMGPLSGSNDVVATWRFQSEVPEVLPPEVDLYDRIPVRLCLPDVIFGFGDFSMMVWDLLGVLSMSLQAAETTIRLFWPCFKGEPPEALA